MTHPTRLAFDTKVALFSENDHGHWIKEWEGDFRAFLKGNDIDGQEGVEASKALVTTGVWRTGGGAAPIFELRLA